jgi:hypothetical protein
LYVLGELPGQADVCTAHGACAAGFDPLIQTPHVELVPADRGVVAPCLVADTAFRALVGAHERWGLFMVVWAFICKAVLSELVLQWLFLTAKQVGEALDLAR